nr:protein FAR1-related sequence 5 [Tanacetum cinerariifolium]
DNLEQLVRVPMRPAVDVNNPTVGSTKGRKKLCLKGGKEKAIEKSLKGKNSCSLSGGTVTRGHARGGLKFKMKAWLKKKCVKRKL